MFFRSCLSVAILAASFQAFCSQPASAGTLRLEDIILIVEDLQLSKPNVPNVQPRAQPGSGLPITAGFIASELKRSGSSGVAAPSGGAVTDAPNVNSQTPVNTASPERVNPITDNRTRTEPDNAAMEEKFRLLKEAGIFEGTDTGNPSLSETMNRAEFAAILAAIMQINEDTRLNSGQGPFDDITITDPSQIEDWMQQYVAVALQTISGFTDNSQQGDDLMRQGEQLQDILEKMVKQASSVGGPWSDFPNFAANNISSAAPTQSITGNPTATYSGRMAGSFADGAALTGNLTMLFDFNNQTINGGVEIGRAHV